MAGCCGSGGDSRSAVDQREAPADRTGIDITKNAASKIKSFLKTEKLPVADYGLRLSVDGGGCSGFSYSLELDKAKDGDLVFERHGARVMMHPETLQYVDGSVFDYVETVQGAGFAVDNPKIKRSCGCGNSFAV
ncbi:MAG: iron-sulfur cluster assembly accessory protein [candidate division Zixibacteria bacterium]|nr:iron-sulfur cluster assembly accessory protein [candidate division Zixibacteria bacterium]MBU1470115.1 iron-sulfur cluster assembly accessory protein [candidate division Zixibacteria bacterium]MBU2626497.1 iron-sulfur cluster assembly accessory protein [candidate division Zixibacteria bacterium]